MTKAILKFDLSAPDDIREHKLMLKANYMAFFIWELMLNKKKEMQWVEDKGEFTTTVMWEMLWELMQENGINIDDLG